MDLHKPDQYYYSHGKLLLSGEYFVLDGARAFAIPTKLGQSLSVYYKKSFNPFLYWKSLDVDGNVWFEGKFEFWHFDYVGLPPPTMKTYFLQKILRQVRRQNTHFLRENMDVFCETRLEFPLNWGLGSSSTLLYNIAQWGYVAPFELQRKVTKGSGFDMACAQSLGPIVYEKMEDGQNWSLVDFNPPFLDQIYFLYLGHKKNSNEAIEYYYEKSFDRAEIVQKISELTMRMVSASTVSEFESALTEHEETVSKALELTKIKESVFVDFWGTIKSLGAWGGDFAMVVSLEGEEKTRGYFQRKGYDIFIPFNKIALFPPTKV